MALCMMFMTYNILSYYNDNAVDIIYLPENKS